MDPFLYTSGPQDADVIVVGEAWGAQEEAQRLPFVGQSGALLRKLLAKSGIDPNLCLFTNVVNARPALNEFQNFLYLNKERAETFRGLKPKPLVIEHVRKLEELIRAVKPKLIIACGNIALWALTGRAKFESKKGYTLPSGISSFRGSQLFSLDSIPVLPIFHPALILRDHSASYITTHDLSSRAARFLRQETFWIEPTPVSRYYHPTWEDIVRILVGWVEETGMKELPLSVDIETYKRKFTTVVGLSDGTTDLVIPFFYFKDGKVVNFLTEEQELFVVQMLKILLEAPNTRIIGQNFIYDYQFLKRELGITCQLAYDTMLMHHLCWPGTPKGLDYLSSLYCEHHVYWKDETQDWDGQGLPEDYWNYNAKDTSKTFEIHTSLKALITKLGFDELWQDRIAQWNLAAEMSTRGVRYDGQKGAEIRLELLNIAAELETFLLGCMPEDLRFSSTGSPYYKSPTWFATILYDYLKIQPVLHKKTKKPTTDTASFDTLRKRAPYLTEVFSAIQQLRSIGVFASNFLDVNTGFDGRLRCSFNVGGTDTFRWSSSANGYGEGTNLQNIPKGDD